MKLPDNPREYQLWMDGAWTPSSGKQTITRTSPAHDVPVSVIPDGTAADVERAVAAASKAFQSGPWPETSGAERAALLLRTSALLRDHTEELALIETLESGKPIAQARDEIGWAAGIWDYAASLARQVRGDSFNTLGRATLGVTLREPVGVVGLITPWNFPLLIISQKLPFALAAGCTAVIKPSEFTSGTTLRLAELLSAAGLPPGVVNVVTGYGDPVGAAICRHPDVEMVSFTGSTRVGKVVLGLAAESIKKVSLELGGKNPQVIFPDADLDAALDAVVLGAYFNMGECCNAGSRILVHEDIAEAFLDRVVAAAAKVRVGDPLDPATQLGAIINPAQFARITECIAKGKDEGAALRTGGHAVAHGRGLFIAPTVFDRVPRGSTLAVSEVFGPVLSAIRFSSEAEAIAIANETSYGLSAAVWTRDFDRALRLARTIRAGTVWVNTFLEGPQEMPFGGYRMSGLGRELGRHAVDEYTELKSVTMHLGPRQAAWVK